MGPQLSPAAAARTAPELLATLGVGPEGVSKPSDAWQLPLVEVEAPLRLVLDDAINAWERCRAARQRCDVAQSPPWCLTMPDQL